jgi:hypothetical protein
MKRIRVSLVLLAATLFIGSCARMPQDSTPAPGPSANANLAAESTGPCRAVRNADAPIVCVDDSQSVLRVDHDPFVLHETPSPAATAPPAVQWFTMSGRGELKVVFKDTECVRNVRCAGSRCTAVASKLDPGEKEQRCKYDVQLTGHPDLDPDGILTGCCVAPTP